MPVTIQCKDMLSTIPHGGNSLMETHFDEHVLAILCEARYSGSWKALRAAAAMCIRSTRKLGVEGMTRGMYRV